MLLLPLLLRLPLLLEASLLDSQTRRTCISTPP